MSKKVEITKIKIKLKSQEIELTAEEAKQLKEELNKLFGEPPSIIFKEKIIKDDWYPVPSIPWTPPPQNPWETGPWVKPSYPEIWCQVNEGPTTLP